MNIFSKIFLLTTAVSPLVAMDTPLKWGNHQIQQQLRLQAPVNRNDLLSQYYDLFLDDFDKLMRQGKSAEAKALAAKKEKKSIDTLNNRFDKNKAMTYAQYRESQNRKEIELNERYSANHFRLYNQDTQKLIAAHEANIRALQEELTSREDSMKRLMEKEEYGPNQKKLLRKKIDNDYVRLNEEVFSFFLRDDVQKKYPIFTKLDGVQKIINGFYQSLQEESPIQGTKEANDQIHLILEEISEGLKQEKDNFSKLSWMTDDVLRYVRYLLENQDYDSLQLKEGRRKQMIDAYQSFEKEITLWLTEESLTKHPKLQELFEIKKIIDTMVQGEPSLEDISAVRSKIEQSFKALDINISQGYNLFQKSYSLPLCFISDIEKWFTTSEHESLDTFERYQIDQMRLADEAFIDDTNNQIAKEQKRIAFIKAHPDFFKIQASPRSEILGVDFPEYWSTDFSPIHLGKGVIVGVVDNFHPGEQNFKFVGHAINPDYQGDQTFEGVGTQPKPDHGPHVAGIIAGDLWDPLLGMKDMTIGVAPQAMFEMLHSNSLASKTSEHHGMVAKPVDDIEKQKKAVWTPDKMAMAITELVKNGNVKQLVARDEIPDIDFSLDSVAKNSIVNSPAHILNMSITFGNFGRFTRQPLSHFEGESYTPGLVASLQTRLGVLITGNDGMDLSTTNQARLLKALARSPATATKIVITTNLMQDGLTLHPSANTPGNDVYLQNCTLSALGTDVTSSILQKNENNKLYGEMTGTSMAAPHVSGVAAIILSNYQELKPDQLSSCLLKGATPLLINAEGIPYEVDTTAGELNAQFEALDEFAEGVTTNQIFIPKEDWIRGKQTYGQGRINLEGALIYAEVIAPNGTLQKYRTGDLS